MLARARLNEHLFGVIGASRRHSRRTSVRCCFLLLEKEREGISPLSSVFPNDVEAETYPKSEDYCSDNCYCVHFPSSISASLFSISLILFSLYATLSLSALVR